MSYVEFKKICKRYEKQEKLAVTDFNLEINKGEFIVFVGPSGCGKSTTLRMLAGLENITSGEVLIDEKVVNKVHPKDRDIAMVFQNYALYPHMTVGDNIRFGLKIKKLSKIDIEKKVKWASDILGLGEYINCKPKDLSGGQRQRVALGRAIVRNPKVFLMDEPLSNLDAKLRVSMRNEITKLHQSLKATTIYVTHDQVEAMTMADRIVVMKDGFVQQVGTPKDLYSKPANVFVASFIGAPQMNLLQIEVKGNKVKFANGTSLEIPEGVIKKLNKEGKMIIGIRPEHITVDRLSLENFSGEVTKSVISGMERMGYANHVFTSMGDDEIILKINSQIKENIGDEIEYRINISKAHFFDADTKVTII